LTARGGAVAIAIALAIPGVMLAGCADRLSGAGTGDPSLVLVADDLRFSPTRLVVEADRPFEVMLDNRERGIPHNVSIYRDDRAESAILVGEISIGESQTTNRVGALAAGTYFFRCDIHRVEMTGALEVR
jgi:plastocyanin